MGYAKDTGFFGPVRCVLRNDGYWNVENWPGFKESLIYTDVVKENLMALKLSLDYRHFPVPAREALSATINPTKLLELSKVSTAISEITIKHF